MKFKYALTSLALSVAILSSVPSTAFAIGGASGAKVDYQVQGKIGEVVMNPYDIAPLTAVIRNGGYQLRDVHVRIVPKENGQEIAYKVNNKYLLTYGGIPVFGLYPDYVNTVEVEYTRIQGSKTENIKESYKMYAPPAYSESAGTKEEQSALFTIDVKKVSPEFKDRLYLLNNTKDKSGNGTRTVWNNPTGGALEWNFTTANAIIDTSGDIRWFMNPSSIYDLKSIYRAGVMMGFKQNQDGALSWGYGQRYVKYDIMGREIFNRRLPDNYNDFSHSMDNAPNGHYFLRVASSNYKRPDGKNVRTVRDVIAEVDQNGVVVDEWRLFDILDPYRDVIMKTLDQGAVCLNIDASQSGHTLSEEDLAALDSSDKFGDIVGSGAGRNWAHVNSVDYDSEDDSIIISFRHQSAIIKIGRDKKVKWILGTPAGWKAPFNAAILTLVDSKGQKISCQESGCEGDFDWTWTQHTAFKIDSKSKGDILYLSAFDNGDGRGLEQPAMQSMKYSRSVIYKIDQKNKTVQQIWQYGKERGNEWFSPVTSITEYQTDKNSVFVYSATAGGEFDLSVGAFTSLPNPYLEEFRWGEKEPAVEMQIHGARGYQAMPFSLTKALTE